MKTKILNIFMLLAVAVGFAACNDDTEPVLSQPQGGGVTQENIPEAIVLDKDNPAAEAFTLTWATPQFNVGVVKSYRIEVANSEDFATTASVAVTSDTTYTVTASELNTAVLEFMPSVEDVSPIDVYVRVRCELNDDPSWVMTVGESYKVNVTPYPGEYPRLYVVGSIQGWNISASNYFLRDRTGENVFTGELGIPAGAQFRFYTELGNWDTNTYGSQVDDAGVNITLTDRNYEGALVAGKGSWIFPTDAEGTYNCTVDLTNMTVKFEYAGEYRDTAEDPGTGGEVEVPTGCFVVGNINNWSTEASATEGQMTETEEGSGVWTGTFAMPDSGDGNSYFRFYTQLSNDWATGSYGAPNPNEDGNEILKIVDGYAESELVEDGQGTFVIPSGTYMISVDFNTNMMTIELTE